MEALTGPRLEPLEDSTPLAGDAGALRGRYERDGFLLLRGAIDRAAVLALRRAVLRHAESVGWLAPGSAPDDALAAPGRRIGDYEERDWCAMQAGLQTCRELAGVGDAPALLAALGAAVGRPAFLYLGLNSARIVSPHPDLVTRPHQDRHYVGVRGPFVTTWVPLGDCPVRLGPLAILPGSHRRGLQPHYGRGILDGGVELAEDGLVWRTTDFRTGDALAFSPLAIHRSLPNRSGDRLRLSVDLRHGFAGGDDA